MEAPVGMRPPSGTMVLLGDTGEVQMLAWEHEARPGRWAIVAVVDGEIDQVSLEQWPSWEAAKDHAVGRLPITWWSW